MNERLARAGLLSLVGGGLGSAMGLVLSVVVGRKLGNDGAGQFFSTVAAFTILSNLLELGADTGLVRALSREVALGRLGDIRRTVLVAVVPVACTGVLGSALAWLLAPQIFAGNDDAAAVVPLFRTMVPFILAGALLLVVLGGTRGLGTVQPFNLIWNIGVSAARPALVGLAVALGWSITGVMTLWSLPLVVALAIAAVILRHQVRAAGPGPQPGAGSAEPPIGAPVGELGGGELIGDDEVATPTATSGPTDTRSLFREFWSFSAPRGIAATLEILQSWVDVLLVASLRSPAEAGVYAIVSRSVTSGLLVEAAARVAVSPRISAMLAHEDRDGASGLQTRATRAMVLVGWPFYITLAVFGPVILRVFGDDFAAGANALAVLSGAMMVLIIGGMVQTILLMGGRSHWQLGNKAISLTVLVVGNLVLDRPFGIVGAACAWALTILVDTLLAVVQVDRGMRVRTEWRPQLLPGCLAVAVFGGVGLALRASFGASWPTLIAHLLVAGTLYLAVCLRLRTRLGFDLGMLAVAVRPARLVS